MLEPKWTWMATSFFWSMLMSIPWTTWKGIQIRWTHLVEFLTSPLSTLQSVFSLFQAFSSSSCNQFYIVHSHMWAWIMDLHDLAADPITEARARSPLFMCWVCCCPASRMPGTGRRQTQGWIKFPGFSADAENVFRKKFSNDPKGRKPGATHCAVSVNWHRPAEKAKTWTNRNPKGTRLLLGLQLPITGATWGLNETPRTNWQQWAPQGFPFEMRWHMGTITESTIMTVLFTENMLTKPWF